MILQHKKWFRKRTGAVRIENGLKHGNPIFAWLLILPSFLTWVVFWLYVNIDSIFLSFQTANGNFTLQHYRWVIDSFKSSGGEEGFLLMCVKNTLKYFFTNYFIIQTANVIVAYFFYKRIKGYKQLRFLVYLPNLLAGAVMATVYKQFIRFDGPVVDLFVKWGWIADNNRPQWLYSDQYAMTLSIVYSLWLGVGGTMVYSMAAMSRIPKEVLESAQLDGITPFKEFVSLIVPLIGGTLSTLYIIGVAGFLSAGGATLMLTNGNYNTQTLSFWIFWQTYTGGSTGTSTAVGLCMTAVGLPITYLVKWIADKITPEVSF